MSSADEHEMTLEKIPRFEETDIIDSLSDGVIIMEALSSMDPGAFKSH